MSKFKKLHIVIAEDDPDDAMIIEGSFINNDDFESVTLVNNGQELLDYLKSARIPDVLLTDINMPIMDGIEALETIYNSENLKTIACFVYSTSINPSYEIKCKSLGVIGYLVKPNNIEDFDEIPKEILALLKREI